MVGLDLGFLVIRIRLRSMLSIQIRIVLLYHLLRHILLRQQGLRHQSGKPLDHGAWLRGDLALEGLWIKVIRKRDVKEFGPRLEQWRSPGLIRGGSDPQNCVLRRALPDLLRCQRLAEICAARAVCDVRGCQRTRAGSDRGRWSSPAPALYSSPWAWQFVWRSFAYNMIIGRHPVPTARGEPEGSLRI